MGRQLLASVLQVTLRIKFSSEKEKKIKKEDKKERNVHKKTEWEERLTQIYCAIEQHPQACTEMPFFPPKDAVTDTKELTNAQTKDLDSEALLEWRYLKCVISFIIFTIVQT